MDDIDVVITFTHLTANEYAINVENLMAFLEENGTQGRVALVQCLEALTNHVKHGPHIMSTPKQLQ
jgi:D-mannonate dehydratase